MKKPLCLRHAITNEALSKATRSLFCRLFRSLELLRDINMPISKRRQLGFIQFCCCLLLLATTKSRNDGSAINSVDGFSAKPTSPTVPNFSSAIGTNRVKSFPNALSRHSNSRLFFSGDDRNSNSVDSSNKVIRQITEDPKRSIAFSVLMSLCGAGLGPFLDSYHSAFGVLKYDEPIRLILWGSETYPALTTTWWVPELFGLAGFIIGWLYILLDASLLEKSDERLQPSVSKILVGISFFTLQYWLSGILVQADVLDRTGILNLMSVLAAAGFLALDSTFSGLLVSLATCIGGPLIEAGLITATANGVLTSGYHYNDLGETGFFPLWIVPVYFLGGPANGNLARGFWNMLSGEAEESNKEKLKKDRESCPDCQGTRRVMCPNCDGIGTYVAMGNRTVKCTSCNGRGFVMCRTCFDLYDDDPYDIGAIRETMNRMPD